MYDSGLMRLRLPVAHVRTVRAPATVSWRVKFRLRSRIVIGIAVGASTTRRERCTESPVLTPHVWYQSPLR